MEPRLKTKVWIQAGLRQCFGEGLFAAVVRHGDDDAGAVVLKLTRPEGCEILTQARTGDGAPAWLALTDAGPVPEPQADALIAEQERYDPDLWVIEIESPDGRHPFPGERIV